MNRIQRINEEMLDWEIEEVNKYLKGEHVWLSRGTKIERYHVTSCMMMAIKDSCHIHDEGVELCHIDFGSYLREKQRIRKYWKRVANGDIIDTRTGIAVPFWMRKEKEK